MAKWRRFSWSAGVGREESPQVMGSRSWSSQEERFLDPVRFHARPTFGRFVDEIRKAKWEGQPTVSLLALLVRACGSDPSWSTESLVSWSPRNTRRPLCRCRRRPGRKTRELMPGARGELRLSTTGTPSSHEWCEASRACPGEQALALTGSQRSLGAATGSRRTVP